MADFLASLLDVLFLVGLALAIARSLSHILKSGHPPLRGRSSQSPAEKADGTQGKTARDPVCGIFVSTEVSHRLVRDKETLHFCSEECLQQYQKEVARR